MHLHRCVVEKVPEMEIKTFERCYLSAGIIVSLTACLLENFVAASAVKHGFVAFLSLDTAAVVFSSAFFLLNLYAWKLFLQPLMSQRVLASGNSRGLKKRVLFFALAKISLLALLFFVVFRAPKHLIYSFVVGFSGCLFLGVLLAAIFGNIEGLERKVNEGKTR